jgi:hypothetical protein
MQIMRHKPMEKTSAFYLWKTKERLPLLFSWLFWFYCRLPLFSPLFFLSQWRKDQRKKKTSMFPCYLCFHSLPLLRFSFLSLSLLCFFFCLLLSGFLLFFCPLFSIFLLSFFSRPLLGH